VDARTFLGLEATEDPLRWRLEVTNAIASGYGQLFGGCGLAAAIVAIESATGRNTVWASAQYLRFAEIGTMLDLEVTVFVSGYYTAQGRVTASAQGQEILAVQVALGDRPDLGQRTLAPFPDVPGPDDCPSRRLPATSEQGLLSRVETRLARGRQINELSEPGPGRIAMWARVIDALDPSAAWLAILGDLVPAGVADARGVPGGGNSLDNTLRVVRLVPSKWVLCEIGIDSMARGFAHGWGRLWAEDGTLMGTASQSVIVRSHQERRSPSEISNSPPR
jgi:acyl-CoA thioesterase